MKNNLRKVRYHGQGRRKNDAENFIKNWTQADLVNS